MSNQLRFAEFEDCFKEPAWQPVPATLARVKRYFEGYRANDREIFAKRRHFAERLEMSIRTLARYLKHLRETGWMLTVRRKAHSAIRKVLQALLAVPSRVLCNVAGPLTEGSMRGKKPPQYEQYPSEDRDVKLRADFDRWEREAKTPLQRQYVRNLRARHGMAA